MENVIRALMPAAALSVAMAVGSRSGDESADLDARPDASESFSGQEIGHEEHRNVLRSVLQDSGVVLINAYFTGDASSASALVVSVPTLLLNNHYSRAFEEEADNYAFASLAAHHISPGRFAEVHKADPHFRHEVGYLSTHPLSVDVIMSARKAAEKFEELRDDYK